MMDNRSICPWPGSHPDYIHYHNTEWGKPCYDEQKLFEKLCLEGQQAGLSWLVVLRKREHYRRCFHNFNPQQVAQMTDAELLQLAQDPSLIRHPGKLMAIRSNAQAYLRLQAQGINFSIWLWSFIGGSPIIHHYQNSAQVPTQTTESQAMSKALKKAGFTFVGLVGCYAFMQSMGMVNDHLVSCSCHPDAQQSSISTTAD